MRRSYVPSIFIRVLFIAIFFVAFNFDHGIFSAPEFSFAADAGGGSVSPPQFSEEELVSMVKPAVVRIVVHVEGDVSVVPFKINLKDFTIGSISGQKPLKMPINMNLAGSGFAVNPDGYILTNAHVVSDYTVKKAVVLPIIQLVLAGEISSLRDADAKAMNQRTQEESFAFGQQILDYVINASTFNFNKNISVLNPTSNETSFDKLAASGFPAQVVSTNESWYKDNRDVAVLKINEQNLPSLRLGTSEPLSVGRQVYVFGFPSNAELGSNNLLESTFTKGVISAVKSSPNNDFKIFQTDAKVSMGSSGGPLFNTLGQVAGLVTFETQSNSQISGDNFAFAIPADIAKAAISENFIINDEGAYGPHMKTGLALLHDNHCKSAIAEFNLAKGVNEKFGVAKYVDPYIAKCNTLIASGLSIDSSWDELRAKFRGMGMLAWALVAVGFFLVVMVGVGIAILLKRLKNDKTELEQLEHALERQNNGLGTATNPTGLAPLTTIVKRVKDMGGPQTIKSVPHEAAPSQAPLSAGQTTALAGDVRAAAPGEPIPPRPELVSYIKQARQAGMTFQMIEQALKDAGWDDGDITRALSVPQQ
jgi:S1-C subfamily serine protease